jgi:acyl-CoA thioester hydrolase
MPEPYRTSRRVEFRDTDAGGIAHFSTFFLYMEQAEHELLRHLGMSVHRTDGVSIISWPRVSARCDYQSPVKFEDQLDIEVRIVRVGEKSVTYEFNFACQGRAIAEGQITAVCCQIEHGQPPKSIPIPADIAARLKS